jgi:DNA integrity scanning protein DisA with diadenylate cyclase activity
VKDLIKKVCTPERRISPEVLESLLNLSLEIAREGREGRKIGTIFTLGDEDRVLAYSRPLILDPLFGHPEEVKMIADQDMQETIKELAQLDGAFVVTGKGIVISAARYLEAPTRGVVIPTGLGARHMAAAAISLYTKAVAVVVSTSSVVRIFLDGKIVGKLLP